MSETKLPYAAFSKPAKKGGQPILIARLSCRFGRAAAHFNTAVVPVYGADTVFMALCGSNDQPLGEHSFDSDAPDSALHTRTKAEIIRIGKDPAKVSAQEYSQAFHRVLLQEQLDD